MPKYEITSESRFQLRYFVEADSREEAIEKWASYVDGYQMHIEEVPVDIKTTEESHEDWVSRQHSEGYD